MAHYGLDEYPPGYQTNPYCIEVGARCSLPASKLAHVQPCPTLSLWCPPIAAVRTVRARDLPGEPITLWF